MLLFFLFIRLALIAGNSFNNNLDNVYTLPAMMKISEESAGIYRQIPTAKHPQPLIVVNYNCFKSESTIVHVRIICGFVCDAVDLFNSEFSNHRLSCGVFYFIYIYIYIYIYIQGVTGERDKTSGECSLC